MTSGVKRIRSNQDIHLSDIDGTTTGTTGEMELTPENGKYDDSMNTSTTNIDNITNMNGNKPGSSNQETNIADVAGEGNTIRSNAMDMRILATNENTISIS